MSVAKNRFRLPVAAALVGGVSALILAAVGGVILITFFTARASTLELLRDRADLGLELLETRIRGQLDPITDVGNGLVALIADGDLDPTNLDQVRTAFQGALSAVPQAKAIIYVGTDLQTARVSRGEEPLLEIIDTGISIVAMGGMTETLDGVFAMLDSASRMSSGAWLPPLWVQSLNQPVLNLEVPVRRDGQFVGVLFAVVELGRLVEYLAYLEAQESASAFVLYGPDHVLVHPKLLDRMVSVGEGEVLLPEALTFPDPALSMLAAGMQSVIEPGEDEHRMFTSLKYRRKIHFDVSGNTRVRPPALAHWHDLPSVRGQQAVGSIADDFVPWPGNFGGRRDLGVLGGAHHQSANLGASGHGPQAQHFGCCEHSRTARQPLQGTRRRFPIVQRHDGRAAVV